MTTEKSDIEALIEQLYSLREADQEIDSDIMVALGLAPKHPPFNRGPGEDRHIWYGPNGDVRKAPRYTGRVGTAMALIPDDVSYEIWRHVRADQEFRWRIPYWRDGVPTQFVTHPVAAVALSIVALKTHGCKP